MWDVMGFKEFFRAQTIGTILRGIHDDLGGRTVLEICYMRHNTTNSLFRIMVIRQL